MKIKEIAIIVSAKDPAGMNIRSSLIECQEFSETGKVFDGSAVYRSAFASLYTATEDSIHCEDIDKKISADLFVFATKHQSSANVPSLSAHVAGNWGPAEMGGKDGSLCFAPARYLKCAIQTLASLATGINCEVTMEATHHGPYLDAPSMFIEIGSSESQWKDEMLGKIIAEAIARLAKPLPESISAVLLGGGHYNHEANKLQLDSGYAVGHICPKHHLSYLDKKTLSQAINRTLGEAQIVILDWKGLGPEKQRIIALLDSIGIPYERSKNIKYGMKDS